MVDPERLRDFFAVAAIFGVFGFGWFGWAQERPPERWRPALGVGAVVSLLVGVAGGVLTWLNWSAPSSITGPADGRFFGFVVALELVLGLGGAFVLMARGQPRWIAPWISIVVGVHFVPLVIFFANLTLAVPAVVLVLSAALAIVLNRRRGSTPSAITGLVNGLVLLLTGALNLGLGLTL